MKQTWGMAFNQLLEHEAGFTDDPRDPGNHMRDGRPGCTNLGVTQQAWEDYVGRPVTHDDMKQLTRESVEPFYKKKYWDAIRADDLPLGVDYMVFDVSVNSGPGRAAMILQECVGSKPDGVIGPATLAAVSNENREDLIQEYSLKRLQFMQSLKNWPVHGKGWERRVSEVAQLAKDMEA
jgi:lysozyme family protein